MAQVARSVDGALLGFGGGVLFLSFRHDGRVLGCVLGGVAPDAQSGCICWDGIGC